MYHLRRSLYYASSSGFPKRIGDGFAPIVSARTVTLDVHMNYMGKDKDTKKHKKEKRDSGRASYRFVDRTRVRVSGGSGGNGCLSMERIGRKHKRRPDGGHGGNGGSIVIVADENEQTLRWTSPHVTADSGSHGGSAKKYGRNGKNTVLRVPW